MRKSVLKRTLSAALSAALLFSTLAAALSANAAEGYWEKHSIDYGLEEKMNAENWTFVHGGTHNDTQENLKVYTEFNSYGTAIHMGLKPETTDPDQPIRNSILYSRIQPNLPEGARITEVSFHMRTKAESYKNPSEIIYSYDPETKEYDAIGMSGLWGEKATHIVKQNEETTTPDHPSKHNGVLFTLNCDGETAPPRTDLFETDYNVTLKYTYKADGKADIEFTLTEPMGYTSFGTQTKTITDVENPCLLLSGASPLGGNVYNTWAEYDQVKIEYETFVDLSAQVEAFKAEYPAIALADVNSENAIEKGREANKAIIAWEAISEEMLKTALEDYVADFYPVVERAKGLTTKTFGDNFDEQSLSSLWYEPKDLVNTVGDNPATAGRQTMEYQANGSVRFYNSNNVGADKFNTVYRLTPEKAGVGVVSKASFKFFIAEANFSGNPASPLYVYLGDVPIFVLQTTQVWNEETQRYDITRCQLDIKAKAYKNWSRRVTVTESGEQEANGVHQVADFTKGYTTGVDDPSGWLTFEYVLRDNGLAICNIYNAAGELFLAVTNTAGQSATTDLEGEPLDPPVDVYNYSDLQGIGFSVGTGSAFHTAAYIDDLQISYDRSEALAAPAIEGATIATERTMATQDLQFKATFDASAALPAGYTPVEYGVMLMISQRMPENGLLTIESVGSNGLDLILASKTLAEGESVPAAFTVEMRGTSAKELLGYRFTARAYVVYADEAGNRVYVYSDNARENTAVENGQCSKSVFGIAKAIALAEMELGAPENAEVREIAEKTDAATELEKVILLEYINDNIGVLPQE